MSHTGNQEKEIVSEFSELYNSNNDLVNADNNDLTGHVHVEKELKNESNYETTEDKNLEVREKMTILDNIEIEVASNNLLKKDFKSYSSNDNIIKQMNLEPNEGESNIDSSLKHIEQRENFEKKHLLNEKDSNKSQETNWNENMCKNTEIMEASESLISPYNDVKDSLTILKDKVNDIQSGSFQNTVDNLSIDRDNNENDQNQIENRDIITQLETDNNMSSSDESDDVTHSDVNIENNEIEQKQSKSDFILKPKGNAHVNESQDSIDKQSSDDKVSEAENFVDILGNGLLTKKVIVHGLGRETRPTHGDSVTIQYRGWNNSGELIEDNETSFVLGDGDMIQAFDLGICLAERHEEFELKTDARFAYGSYGWEPHVQPNEALVYRIKLLRVDDPPDYTTFTYQDRMDAADVKRERGNYLYRREEYSLAVNSYSRAIKIIQTDPDYKKASTDISKADMYDLFVKVTNNLAAAQLKLESYDNVIETCNTILNYDTSNVKALFRKGKSLTMKGHYDEAIPILKRALELENSKLIAGEIQRCYQLKRSEDEQRARVCRKMFGTSVKDLPEKSQESGTSSWKTIVHKYYPFIGAVIITGISVILASIAISKSKGN